MACVFDILRQCYLLIIYLGYHLSESNNDFDWSHNFPLVKITPIYLKMTELSPCVGVVIGKRHVLCGSTVTCIPSEVKNYDLKFSIEFEGKSYSSISVKYVEDYLKENDYPDLSLIEVNEDIPKKTAILPINTGAIIKNCQLIYWEKPNKTTSKDLIVYPHKYCLNEWKLTTETQICGGWMTNENKNEMYEEGEDNKMGRERGIKKREVEENREAPPVARGDIKGEDEEALVVEDDERNSESKERYDTHQDGIVETLVSEGNKRIEPVKNESVEIHEKEGDVNKMEGNSDTEGKTITIEDSHLFWGVQGFPLICKGALTALKWSDTALVVNKGRVRLDLYTRLKNYVPWLREHVPDLNEVALESNYEESISDDYGNYIVLQGSEGENLEEQIGLIIFALILQLWELY